ncbi:MAG: DUF5916 domain-containing protein [Pseudomonadales bacterium]
MYTGFIFLALLFWLPTFVQAAQQIPRFSEAESRVQIDGTPSEAIWSKVMPLEDYTVSYPDLDEAPAFRTSTRMFYTERGLYVSSINFQPTDSLMPRLTARDQSTTRDGFLIVLDTSGEGRYGYWFEVGLGGSLMDGILLPERHFRSDWDGPWRGASTMNEDGWTVEMFLPWAMLNMPRSDDGTRRMGVYFNRRLGALDQRWGMPNLPSTQPSFISGFLPVEFKKVEPRQEYSLYPFVSYDYDSMRARENYRAGFDLFWRPSSQFHLSATVKPDFGQVESDNVDVNLTAFETFNPERRQFFLENQPIFTTSPRSPNQGTLLSTRRIGTNLISRAGRPDFTGGVGFDKHQRTQSVELIGALKATGQYGPWRYGVMGASEQETVLDVTSGGGGQHQAPGRDFGVARLVYEDVVAGSRRSVGWLGTITEHPGRRAVTQAVDGHYRDLSGVWTWDGQLFHSDIDGVGGIGFQSDLVMVPAQGRSHKLEIEYFDRRVNLNDLGFMRRNDQIGIDYDYRVNEERLADLRRRQTYYLVRTSLNTARQVTGAGVFLRRSWEFHDSTRLRLGAEYRLPQWDDRNSVGNGAFRREDRFGIDAAYNTDSAKPISFEAGIDLLQESEGGLRRALSGRLVYRPSDRFTLRLGTKYTDRDAWLIHSAGPEFTSYHAEEWRPRFSVDSFINAQQQLRVALEWVGIKAFSDKYWRVPEQEGKLTQVARLPDEPTRDFVISAINLQARYRWEIAPLSTLYLVYNRSGRLPGPNHNDFGRLFTDAMSDPEQEYLIIKLRYRFGPS